MYITVGLYYSYAAPDLVENRSYPFIYFLLANAKCTMRGSNPRPHD